tara:strand:- start:854 stop:2782 length:1929 start_codon:yes stop_codon:yes gene_type:complete
MTTLQEVLDKQVEEQKKETSIDKAIADSFPCPEGDIFSLPTRADITNAFNEIAGIPGDLVAAVQERKANREKEIAELQELLKNPDLTPEEIAEIQKQIEEKEKFIQTAIVDGIQKQVDEIDETITEFVEDLSDILSPYWEKSEQKRDWPKEAKDAFTELLSEFHTYISTKIADLISKIVSISFTVNILGLQIDVLKLITSPNYRKELQDQIAGKSFTLQIIAKRKRLAEVNEEIVKFVENHTTTATTDPITGNYVVTIDNAEELKALKDEKEKLQEEIEALEKARTEHIDRFFSLIPEEFRQFDGEFGVLDEEAKAKLTWKYIKTEIKEYMQQGLVKLFQDLIGKFDKIWKALGLPDLPFSELSSIINLDIGALISAKIDSLKERFKQSKLGKIKQINTVKKEIEEINKKLENESLSEEERTKLLEELEKKHAEKKALEDDLLKEVKEFNEGVLSLIEEISIFGFDISAIIGGKIDSFTESIEEKIAEISLELKDFRANWHKKIMMEWVNLVKKFFNAIGLGAIFDLLTLTWCDFLKLIGMPFTIPAIAGVAGVMSVKKKNKSTSSRLLDTDEQQKFIDDEVNFQNGDGTTTSFSIPSASGTLKVFRDGEELSSGTDFTIASGNVVLSSALLSNQSVSILKI